MITTAHPNGHFYSPVVDPDTLDSSQIWPDPANVPLGIEFNDASHQHILREVFPKFIHLYDYPERLDEDASENSIQYYTQNSQFSWLDSRTLFVLLNEWKPKRLYEIGSGFSSLLSADVNHRFLNDQIDIRCVEPYPRPFLRENIPGLAQVHENKVEELPFDFFSELEAGDILFIDSSHVSKTGSDVNYLYFQILPRLKPGVLVHIHDIFFPHDYPRDWVITENRSWNEQYVLQAMLMHSKGFKVVFGCSYAFWRYPEMVKDALAIPAGHAFAGGSFWIQRTDGSP